MAPTARKLLVLGLLAAALASPAARAEPVTVTVTREDCARLVPHVPDADVTYQPGVDVNGNPVAPADLDGGLQLELPKEFSFDLQIQPIDFGRRRTIEAERARLQGVIAADPSQAPALADELAALDAEEAAIEQRGLSETTMTVGRVTIESDGRAYFNGQPLQSDEQAALAARCQEILRSAQP